MNFSGQAKRLEPQDIETIAGYLGCQVAAVKAVLEVESRGSGFDGHGRPKMLFEPHVFYRELGPGAKREQAKIEGLAYYKWGTQPYPTDSYPRLERAMLIDETAALRSASWGLHQGMGFNHEIMGFKTVQEYVKAMTYSESAHLYAMAKFIVSKKLQRYLRGQNWSSFAKGYNGSAYAKHGYHTKLEAAFKRRPEKEHYTPPPASVAELNALLGLAVPPKPEPKPEPVPAPPPPYTPPPKEEPSYTGLIVGSLVVASAVAAAAWFFLT